MSLFDHHHGTGESAPGIAGDIPPMVDGAQSVDSIGGQSDSSPTVHVQVVEHQPDAADKLISDPPPGEPILPAVPHKAAEPADIGKAWDEAHQNVTGPVTEDRHAPNPDQVAAGLRQDEATASSTESLLRARAAETTDDTERNRILSQADVANSAVRDYSDSADKLGDTNSDEPIAEPEHAVEPPDSAPAPSALDTDRSADGPADAPTVEPAAPESPLGGTDAGEGNFSDENGSDMDDLKGHHDQSPTTSSPLPDAGGIERPDQIPVPGATDPDVLAQHLEEHPADAQPYKSETMSKEERDRQIREGFESLGKKKDAMQHLLDEFADDLDALHKIFNSDDLDIQSPEAPPAS